MRKFWISLVLVLTLSAGVLLTACGSNGGGGDGDKNPGYTSAQTQFVEFKTQALNIVDAFSLVVTQSASDKEMLAATPVSSTADAMDAEGLKRKATIAGLATSVLGHERCEAVENFSASLKTLFKQMFVEPLVFGEVLTFKNNSQNFYNTVGSMASGGENSWFVVKKDGFKTTFFAYAQMPSNGRISYIYFDLFYKNDADFNFLCFSESSDGRFGYYSGDSDFNFAYINCDPTDGYTYANSVTVFDGLDARNVNGDVEFSNQCAKAVKSALSTDSFKPQISALAQSSAVVEIKPEDFNAVTTKYQDEFFSGDVNLTSSFLMEGDTLVRIENYTKETLVIPKYVKKISAELRLPDCVKKLVVSSSLKKMVVWQDALDGSGSRNFVECPFNEYPFGTPFFSLKNDGGFNPVQITVLGEDGLFRKDDGGNVYLNLKESANSSARHNYLYQINNLNFLASKANIAGFDGESAFVIDGAAVADYYGGESLYKEYMKGAIPELSYSFTREEELVFPVPSRVRYNISWQENGWYGVGLKSYFGLKSKTTFDSVTICAIDSSNRNDLQIDINISDLETINSLVFGDNTNAHIRIDGQFVRSQDPQQWLDFGDPDFAQRITNQAYWPKVKSLDLGNNATELTLGNVLIGDAQAGTLNHIACPDSLTTFAFSDMAIILSDYVIEGKNGGYLPDLTFKQNYSPYDLDDDGFLTREYFDQNKCPIYIGVEFDKTFNLGTRQIRQIADNVTIRVKTNAPLRKMEAGVDRVRPTELWFYTINYFNDATVGGKYQYPARAFLKIEQNKDTLAFTTVEEFKAIWREKLLSEGVTGENEINANINQRLSEYNPDLFTLDAGVFKVNVTNATEQFNLWRLVGKRGIDFNWQVLYGGDASSFDAVSSWADVTHFMEGLELGVGNNLFVLKLLNRVGDTPVEGFEPIKINVYRKGTFKVAYHVSNGLDEDEAIFEDPTFDVEEGSKFTLYNVFAGVNKTHPLYDFGGWFVDKGLTVAAFESASGGGESDGSETADGNSLVSVNAKYTADQIKLKVLKVKNNLLNAAGDTTDRNFWINPSKLGFDENYSVQTKTITLTQDMVDENGVFHLYSKWNPKKFAVSLGRYVSSYTNPVGASAFIQRGCDNFIEYDGATVTMPTQEVTLTGLYNKTYGTFVPTKSTVTVSVCGENITLSYGDFVTNDGNFKESVLKAYTNKVFAKLCNLAKDLYNADDINNIYEWEYNRTLSFSITENVDYIIYELSLVEVDNVDILSGGEAFVDVDEDLPAVSIVTKNGTKTLVINVYKYLKDENYKNKPIKFAYENTTENGEFIPADSNLWLVMPRMKDSIVSSGLCDAYTSYGGNIETAVFDQNGKSVTSSSSSFIPLGLYMASGDGNVWYGYPHYQYIPEGSHTVAVMPKYRSIKTNFLKYTNSSTYGYLGERDGFIITLGCGDKITAVTTLTDLKSSDFSRILISQKDLSYLSSKGEIVTNYGTALSLTCFTSIVSDYTEETVVHSLKLHVIEGSDSKSADERMYYINRADFIDFLKGHSNISGSSGDICANEVLAETDTYPCLTFPRFNVVFEETQGA